MQVSSYAKPFEPDAVSEVNNIITIEVIAGVFFSIILISLLIIMILKHKKLYAEKLKLVKFHRNMSATLCIIYFVWAIFDMIWSVSCCCTIIPAQHTAPSTLEVGLAQIIAIMPILIWIASDIFSKKYIKNAENIILSFNIATIIYLILLLYSSMFGHL